MLRCRLAVAMPRMPVAHIKPSLAVVHIKPSLAVLSSSTATCMCTLQAGTTCMAALTHSRQHLAMRLAPSHQRTHLT